jgi:hypothetical protein
MYRFSPKSAGFSLPHVLKKQISLTMVRPTLSTMSTSRSFLSNNLFDRSFEDLHLAMASSVVPW